MDDYSLKDIPEFLHNLAIDEGAGTRAAEMLEEAARVIESIPVNMGHMDAVEGALTSATRALTEGAQLREWDSLQVACGEAWADIQRAIGYTRTLKSRLPEGDGFD